MKNIINLVFLCLICFLLVQVFDLKRDNKILINKPAVIVYKEKIVYQEKIVYKDKIKIIYPKNYNNLILLRNEIETTLINLNWYSKYEDNKGLTDEQIYLKDLKDFTKSLK